MYITGFFHVIGLLLRKPGSFTIYFSTIQFSSFFFFSPVSLKQSPAATAAAGGAARRRCNGRKMLPEWAKRVRHEQTRRRRRRQRQVCGGARHASTAGMKWRRNDDDERNLLIEYDSLAFQAENGKFSAHHDYYRMKWRGVPRHRRPRRRISVVCSGARGGRGVAGSQWNPRSILSIEVHHTSSIKTRWLKLEFGNESQSTAPPPLCIPMLAQSAAAARRSCRCRHCSLHRTGWYSWKEGQEHTTEWISFRLTFKKVMLANFLWLKTTFPFHIIQILSKPS